MPGFTRAYLPAAHQTPNEVLKNGDVIPVLLQHVMQGAALQGKAALVVSRNTTVSS
jgi:transcription antitermination factor NusA-like protein